MAVLTDGREWHFYLPAGEGDYSERRVHRLHISNDDLEKIEASLTRYLYYDAVRSGKAIEAAQNDYRDLAEKRQIRTTLPEAWKKLVESEDDILIELLADKVRDLCGIEPDPDTTAAFLREQVQLVSKDAPSTRPASSPQKPKQPTRLGRTDQRSLESIGYTLYGQIHRARNAIDVLESILKGFSERDSAFLEKFARRFQTSGKVRYVARSKKELNPGRLDLTEDARELEPGWWIYTKLSNKQKERVVKMACEVAGIQYGTDLRVNFG